MKAFLQTGYGDLRQNLSFFDIETPVPSENEVLVKVHYASLNPHDYKVVLGEFRRFEKLTFPSPIGSDFAGTVIGVGQKVTQYKPGDQVFGIAKGSLAEYCLADCSAIYLKPESISFEDISTCALVGLTTLQAFARNNGIHKDDKVLIHAGSGGVGHFAIQYAKAKEAYVYTTTSTPNLEWVKSLGADRVIDYTKEDYLQICSSLDIVLDTLGGQHTFDAFKTIKKGGSVISLLPAEINSIVAQEVGLPRLITLVVSLKPSKIKTLMKQTGVLYSYLFMRPDKNHLKEIATLLSNKQVSPMIEKTYRFEKCIDAFLHQQEGHTKGKLSIRISE